MSVNDLLVSRREECVDARVVAVTWLISNDVTERRLSLVLGWSQQRINYLKNMADARLRRRKVAAIYTALEDRLNGIQIAYK
ncbi:MAG: hypothetical protein U0L19_11035 [Bacteroidales bacterium]|nr:hypothetical protein [Bacteroidales bacterium]